MHDDERPASYPPALRSREALSRAEGYLDLSLDLLLARSPAYDTVGWQEALVDLESRLGKV